MKLTGHESSVLAFIAQRPECLDDFKHFLGAHALAIAESIVNPTKDAPDGIKTTAESIRQWAKERLK